MKLSQVFIRWTDPDPSHSLAGVCGRPGLIVLRSFGKFYGLAGLRLGFVLGPAAAIARLAELAGPWSVSGPAIEVGTLALADRDWVRSTQARLVQDAQRLDAICMKIGWQALGGTLLFRLYDTEDAAEAQAMLARRQIWSRIFPYSHRWIRLGLPGTAKEWARLAAL